MKEGPKWIGENLNPLVHIPSQPIARHKIIYNPKGNISILSYPTIINNPNKTRNGNKYNREKAKVRQFKHK
jgi:hypothetical protein